MQRIHDQLQMIVDYCVIGAVIFLHHLNFQYLFDQKIKTILACFFWLYIKVCLKEALFTSTLSLLASFLLTNEIVKYFLFGSLCCLAVIKNFKPISLSFKSKSFSINFFSSSSLVISTSNDMTLLHNHLIDY